MVGVPNSVISIRSLSCDWYLCKLADTIFSRDYDRALSGTESDGESLVTKAFVPVLRVFGPTSSGKKALVRIHGMLPYFYTCAPSGGNISSDWLKKLKTSLNYALNISLKKETNKDRVHRNLVHSVTLVTSRSFYGFHLDTEVFLKICLYDPRVVRRAAELLQNAAIMDLRLQPFEVHVPFVLRFFIDHNLYGMDFVHLDKCNLRKINDKGPSTSDAARDPSSKFETSLLSPQSTCELELDCHIENIVNTQQKGFTVSALDTKNDSENIRMLRVAALTHSGQTILPSVICLRRSFHNLQGSRTDQSFSTVLDDCTRVLEKQLILFERSEIAPSTAESRYFATLASHLQEFDLEEKRKSRTNDQTATDIVDESRERPRPNESPEEESVNERLVMELSQCSEASFRQENDDNQLHLSQFIDSFSDIPMPNAVNLRTQNNSEAVEAVSLAEDDFQMAGLLQDLLNQEVGTSQGQSPVAQEKIFGPEAGREPEEIERFDEEEDRETFEMTQLVHNEYASSSEESDMDLDPNEPLLQIDGPGDSKRGRKRKKQVVRKKVTAQRQDKEDGHQASLLDTWATTSGGFRSAGTGSSLWFQTNTIPPKASEVAGHYGCSTRTTRQRTLSKRSAVPGSGAPRSENDFEAAPKSNFYDSSKVWNSLLKVTPELIPPSTSEVADWLAKEQKQTSPNNVASGRQKRNISQIEGPSLNNTYGFDVSYADLQDTCGSTEKLHVLMMSMELHTHTRGNLKPNPEFDSICMISYSTYQDSLNSGAITKACLYHTGLNERLLRNSSQYQLESLSTELDLIDRFVDIVKKLDPDILIGYEVQMNSWGYLIERASHLGKQFCAKISRIPESEKDSEFSANSDDWWSMSNLKIAGRIVLNLWRVMRHEVSLNNYCMENVVFHILRERIPHFSDEDMTGLCLRSCKLRQEICEYLTMKSCANLMILLHCNILGKTAEMAKLFGIQFYDVLTRGTQFRVESMLLRMTKAAGFVAASPSIRQRQKMTAPECIPLTMEPNSQFYTDPVLVLDFQSLYPSIVIAYNYCYSTCLGKVVRLGRDEDKFKFGCMNLSIPPSNIKNWLVHDQVHISPAGVAFVKFDVRSGILPQMLNEILETRIMVKNTMKDKVTKNDKGLTRVLDARQLGLKLIANVTYGYTSANVSGRMPCVEFRGSKGSEFGADVNADNVIQCILLITSSNRDQVADSIVHKGRETLEKAMELVHSNAKWDAKVIYGDTDSMFVLLSGRSKDEAFQIGEEIAKAVTDVNPKPVKLKFEKVYYPCILQSKKRYVGYSYESVDQTEPVFDAKGIETVRRDGCPVVVKMLEKSLRLLFATKRVQLVEAYVKRQLSLIMERRVSWKDFVFAKEYRGRKGYKPSACVPALTIARKNTRHDPRAEPRISERVKYVIVSGKTGDRLISCVREPKEVVSSEGNLRLNVEYYIRKQILPALDRCFGVIPGVSVESWYEALPKIPGQRSRAKKNRGNPLMPGFAPKSSALTISQFFGVAHCLICNEVTSATQDLCIDCLENEKMSRGIGIRNLKLAQKRAVAAKRVCQGCCHLFPDMVEACFSLDCPIFYKRHSLTNDLLSANELFLALQ